MKLTGFFFSLYMIFHVSVFFNTAAAAYKDACASECVSSEKSTPHGTSSQEHNHDSNKKNNHCQSQCMYQAIHIHKPASFHFEITQGQIQKSYLFSYAATHPENLFRPPRL